MIKGHTSLALVTIVGVSAGASTPSAGACIESWSDAALVIKQEQLVVIEQLSPSARARLGGDIVKTTLCSKDGRYIYRLIIRAPDGPLKDVSVDARRPFDR